MTQRITVDIDPNELAKNLGGQLAGVRLIVRDLAGLAGWHSSKASRIEYGKQMPSEDDIKLWCLHCGRPEQVTEQTAQKMSQALADELDREAQHEIATGAPKR